MSEETLDRVTIFRSGTGNGWTVRYGRKSTGDEVAAGDLEEALRVVGKAFDKDGKPRT